MKQMSAASSLTWECLDNYPAIICRRCTWQRRRASLSGCERLSDKRQTCVCGAIPEVLLPDFEIHSAYHNRVTAAQTTCTKIWWNLARLCGAVGFRMVIRNNTLCFGRSVYLHDLIQKNETSVLYGITQWYLLPGRGEIPPLPQPIKACTRFIDHERMKGWVGLVGWSLADGLPTIVVTRQPQVERRRGEDDLPLYHATNQGWRLVA